MNKEEYKAKKRELKLQYKQSKTKEKKSSTPLLQRLSNTVDIGRLRICERFENQAKQLRYKIADPDGHEADSVVDSVNCAVKRFQRKKELTQKDIEVLGQLKLALSTVIHKNLGRKQDLAMDLNIQIAEMMPEEIRDAASKMEEAMDKAIQSLKDFHLQPQKV